MAVELRMVRRAELLHDGVNLAGRNCLGICKFNDQASGLILDKLEGLVVFNAVLHVGEVRDKATHSLAENAGNVAHDVRGMLAGEFDVTGETKVFANDHSVPNADRSREALIMRIAQTENKLAISCVEIFTSDDEAAEVTLTHAGERVFLLFHVVASAGDCLAHLVNQIGVTDWLERFGFLRSGDSGELFGGDFVFGDEE